MASNVPSKDDALAIFGPGASGREIAWLARECFGEELRLVFVSDRAALVGTLVNGFKVRGLAEFAAAHPHALAVVAIGNPRLREACVQKCVAANLAFATLIHPGAVSSRTVSIGEGTVVCAGTVLTTNISIGQHVHVNIGCTISHDAKLADFVTLSPGVHISGWVTIAHGAFLGTGAVVSNGSSDRPIMIGAHAVVGAGACVIRDVPAGATVVGVPASRTLKTR